MTDYQISENFFDAPIGVGIPWDKNLCAGTTAATLPPNWIECNGQTINDTSSPLHGKTIKNMNGFGGTTKYFIRGSTTSGTTGGSETHNHSSGTLVTGFGDNADNAEAAAVTPIAFNTNDHIHQVSGDTASTSTLPSYMEWVFVMRFK